MARINWIETEEASGPVAEIYSFISSQMPENRGIVPDIAKTLSLRPDFLAPVLQASKVHFSDGHLTRAQHEMIACYVAALTSCDY